MKKILILITTLLFLQGCSSNKSYTNDQLQNLTNSVQINQLEKTEFDTKNNKLIITIKDEVINEEGFKSILKSLKINSFKGEQLSYNNLTSEKFDNKDLTIEILTKNNNTLTFMTNNIDELSYNITDKKYSNDFIKSKIKDFSKDVITMDELVGSIETDLTKGRDLGEKANKFSELKQRVLNEINFLKSLSNNNTDYDKLNDLNNRLTSIEKLIPEVITVVDKSLSTKNGSSINSVFLHINDIDRLARELSNI